jgi:hypothetical protein
MFDLFSCIAVWVVGALIVAGLTQWIKNYIHLPGKHKWIYGIIAAALSFLAAYAGGGTTILWNFLGTLAVSQLGYENIMQKFLLKKEDR